jgi:hypothetical protein
VVGWRGVWTETLYDESNSDLCDSETEENTYMSEVGGRNESFGLINDNLKQSNRRGKAVAQRYSMVTIARAERGYTRLNGKVKGGEW